MQVEGPGQGPTPLLSKPYLPLSLFSRFSECENRYVNLNLLLLTLSPVSLDVACVSVCPPVALDMGVGLLCQLFQLWRQVPTGILTLTEWLLGDVKGDQEQETATVEAAGLDEEELLFEKGDLNLWAEPVQWARLLHRHLGVLFKAPGLKALNQKQAELLRLSAEALSLATQQALDGLPALPQFSCSIEHTRLALQQERATLALDILGTLRQTGLSG
ncbi:unnamed protein product [Coregonus sp. 'balchen']|nr:unnamed protein product [Coregonus sp. 'balchen']